MAVGKESTATLAELGEHYVAACKPQTLSRTIEERLLRLNCESIVPGCRHWQLNLKSFSAVKAHPTTISIRCLTMNLDLHNLIDYTGPNMALIVIDGRYSDGCIAILSTDAEVASELANALHAGDNDWAEVRFPAEQCAWFPFAISSTATDAIEQLADKLNKVEVSSFEDRVNWLNAVGLAQDYLLGSGNVSASPAKHSYSEYVKVNGGKLV